MRIRRAWKDSEHCFVVRDQYQGFNKGSNKTDITESFGSHTIKWVVIKGNLLSYILVRPIFLIIFQ